MRGSGTAPGEERTPALLEWEACLELQRGMLLGPPWEVQGGAGLVGALDSRVEREGGGGGERLTES